MIRSLSHRGISREAYLQISEREESEILAEMESDAEQALRREAVLTAIVAAEQIKPSQEDLLQALAPAAEQEQLEPQKLLEDLRSSGRLEELREDLAARMAIELIAERAKPVSVSQAQAREQLSNTRAGAGARPGGGRHGGPASCGPLPIPGSASLASSGGIRPAEAKPKRGLMSPLVPMVVEQIPREG